MVARVRGDRLAKRLDRFAGIPVVFTLGLLRRRLHKAPAPAPAARRIGLLKTSAVGDTVLLSGPAADLRQHFPDAEIVLFVGSSNREAAALIASADRVVELEVERPHHAIREIRRHPVDLLLDFGPWPRINAVLSYCARARWRAGFRTPGQYRHYVYDLVADHEGNRHEIENYRQLLREMGVPAGHAPSLSLGQPVERTPRILVHMFSGGSRASLKEWPEERWVEAVDRLLRETGRDVVLTGGAADRGRAERVRARLSHDQRVVNAAGELGLAATARLVASCSLVVTVDTGILHLASAVGADLIALHGPTEPRRWGALNPNSVSIIHRQPCAPCLSLGFESRCGKPLCMQAIEVDEVVAAARCFLERLTPEP